MVFVLDVAEKGQQGEEEEDGEGCEEEGEGDVVLAFELMWCLSNSDCKTPCAHCA